MRKLLVTIALLALAGGSANAQTPKVELFTGLSYGQFNPGGLLSDSTNGIGRHFSVPGLEATGEYNFTSHIGVIADVSGYGGTADVDSFADHLRDYNYLFGPQLTQRHLGPFDVFVRGLVGTSRARVSFNDASGAFTCPSGLTTATCVQTETRFAYGAGGGIDLNATQHIGLRLIQVDYVRNTFSDCASNQSACAPQTGRQENLRIAAGFNWRF
ncbi:MAG: outer membrane beta-barrel protein [Candidatus Acidiferrum sp.]